ncbi:hypothetical protein JWH17_18425 [Desulfobulbus marinus]|nr:hypothetical protein [Desulfogranum marinum]
MNRLCSLMRLAAAAFEKIAIYGQTLARVDGIIISIQYRQYHWHGNSVGWIYVKVTFQVKGKVSVTLNRYCLTALWMCIINLEKRENTFAFEDDRTQVECWAIVTFLVTTRTGKWKLRGLPVSSYPC